MSWKEFTQNKWTKFIFWALLYLVWVIWLGNFWWLLGLGVIFDIFITRKVHWNFWKKRYKEGEKHSSWNDWLDAVIFAVIVADRVIAKEEAEIFDYVAELTGLCDVLSLDPETVRKEIADLASEAD